jgi:uncharacterized membrane protein
MDNKKCIWILIGFIFLTNLAVLINVPFLRQIMGFIFLTILPGLLIQRILKLNKLGFTEKLILSVGLSISFLMFFGMLFNTISISFGYESPLSTVPILIFFSFVVTLMGVFVYIINKNTVFHIPSFNLETSEKGLLIVSMIFLALSIIGSYLIKTSSNNSILLVLIIGIPIFTVFICAVNNKIPPRIYPVVIFFISLSLILMKALRSNHILGIDVHEEYYIFQSIVNNMHWDILRHNALDACLSISLLPTIYKLYLNVNPEIFFNVFYVLLFSLTPLIVFVISKKYIGDFYAFLASLFFMFQARFIFSAGCARTNLAILFFALAMMTVFSNKIDPVKKRILLIVFTASCIVSHYSTTYIYFVILFVTYIGIEVFSRKYTLKKTISLTGIILFFSIIFVWYSQVTVTAFDAGVHFVGNTLKELQNFFVLESRGDVQALLGQGIAEKGVPHKIEFIFTWLIFAFTAIGIISLIKKYTEMSFPELSSKKKIFLKEKFEVEYSLVALACCALLVVMVVFPHIAVGYAMDRLYCMVTIILSVFFVIGWIVTVERFPFFLTYKNCLQKKYSENKFPIEVMKKKSSCIKFKVYVGVLLVLIPYYLCVTGFMYQAFGYPRQIILNSEGEQADDVLVYDQESYAANWLNTFRNDQLSIYTDFPGQRRLVSQGHISPDVISHYWFSTKFPKIDGYIYLRLSNIKNGKLKDYYNKEYNMVDFIHILKLKNDIYDSGYSRISR